MTVTVDLDLVAEHLHAEPLAMVVTGRSIGQVRTFEYALGLVLPGDDFSSPIAITGSGTFDLNLGDFTPRTSAEPPYQAGNNFSSNRAWFAYTASGPGTLTLATDVLTYNTVLEVWTGPDLADLVLYDWNDDYSTHVSSQVAIVVAAAAVYYVRLLQKTPTDTPVNIVFSYTVVARVATMQLDIRGGTVISSTPAYLQVDVLNGDASAEVAAYVDGDLSTQVGSGTLNELGIIGGMTVLLPSYTAGAHTLDINEISGGTQTGTVDFTITSDPTELPGPQPADVLPVVDLTPNWQIIDPAPGGTTYVLSHNPASMTTPKSPRVFTMDHTTAPGDAGQVVTFEGARKATQWQFSGTVLTTEDVDALVEFQLLQHRILIVDHEDNGYVVTIEGVDAKPVNDSYYRNAQNYTVTLLIYDQFSPTHE